MQRSCIDRNYPGLENIQVMKKPTGTIKSAENHTIWEDFLALVFGTIFVAIGLAFYAKAQILTGSTAGIALLLQYAAGFPFGMTFMLINLPFIALALARLGIPFTVRTFIAVGFISALTLFVPAWLDIGTINPIFAAVSGGALQGAGLLILFRHRTGLGGINVLALYLQDRFGIRAGWFQLSVDGVIMASALFFLPWQNVALSMFGAIILNMVLGINHRPGRYIGVS